MAWITVTTWVETNVFMNDKVNFHYGRQYCKCCLEWLNLSRNISEYALCHWWPRIMVYHINHKPINPVCIPPKTIIYIYKQSYGQCHYIYVFWNTRWFFVCSIYYYKWNVTHQTTTLLFFVHSDVFFSQCIQILCCFTTFMAVLGYDKITTI